MRRSFPRTSRYASIARLCALLFLLWTFIEAFRVRSTIAHEDRKDPPPFGNERIFITSILWTTEAMVRSHYAAAMTKLAAELGNQRVYVSVVESGSLDDTKGALHQLDWDLYYENIRRTFVLDNTTRLQVVEAEPAETGWIVMPYDKRVKETFTTWTTIPKGKIVPRRIPYLSGVRNLALEPLFEMERNGEKFDKILFLNDVAFTNEDVRKLLATRNGDYAAACALDFKAPPEVYDTFALRDSEGYEPITEAWPFFKSKASREALIRGQPVPVESCWNGMLVMDAAPFYDKANPLRFRGIPDSLGAYHLEGSESCLVHTDNPLSKSKGVWVNPNVRVAYSGPAFEQVNSAFHSAWLSMYSIVVGLWRNRLARLTADTPKTEKIIDGRFAAWQHEHPHERETGRICLIDETQILIFNGWCHI